MLIFKKKKFLIIFNKYKLDFIASFLFIITYYLYFLSLEKCFNGFDYCALKTKWILIKLFEAGISYVILSILLEGIILNIISKYHLFHLIFIYILFYNYSHGLDFEDHGYYNFIGTISIVTLILLLFIPFNALIILFKKKNKKYIIIYFGFIILIILHCYFFSKFYLNCNDWGKGLNETYIENDNKKHGCYMKIPKICPYKIGKYIFDFTKWKNVKCHNNKEDTKKVLRTFSNEKYINENTTRVGFPLFNKFPELYTENYFYHVIYKYAKNNLVDMDNETIVKRIYKDYNPEIIVDYRHNSHGEIIINLTKNNSLSKERKKKENTSPYSKNIIIMYIDSVSRAYSFRQLKKTLSFFQQFMSYKGGFHKKFPTENFHSFQFFKYHSFIGYTQSNYPLIFYGSKPGKNIIRITKYFKENGYVICFSNDMCIREMTNTYHNMTYNEIGDHEFILCDPNKKSFNSHVKRCLYNKISTDYLYEFGKQFWKKYTTNRKFLAITSNDGHEGTLEILKYVDNTLFNFLNDLFNQNLLKDTTVFLLSDHGTAMPSPYHLSLFYSLERSLPMLYIISNDRKNVSYNEQYKYIHQNQQILITAYDIYNTLIYLLLGKKDKIPNKKYYRDIHKSRFGKSLFNEIKSKNRTPKKYKNMEQNICI